MQKFMSNHLEWEELIKLSDIIPGVQNPIILTKVLVRQREVGNSTVLYIAII